MCSWSIKALKAAPAPPPVVRPKLVAVPRKPLPVAVMCACGRAALVHEHNVSRGQCEECILDQKVEGAPPIADPFPPDAVEPPVAAKPRPERKARLLVVPTKGDYADQFLCGDSIAGLQALPDKIIDHTITDPPYEGHTHTKALRQGKDGKHYTDDLGFDAITEAQRDEAAKQIVRVTKGWAIVFCEDDALYLWRRALEKYGAKWKRNGVWHKTNAMPKLHGDGPAQGTEHFVIVWCSDSASVWNRGGRSNHWACPKEHSAIHRTKKPQALIEDLVLSFTRPGDLVCDPFAGSGTTPIACRRTGRSYLAWEFREETHRLALAEVNGAKEQMSLFAASFRGDTTMRAGAFSTEEDANKREKQQIALIDEPVKKKRKKKVAS